MSENAPNINEAFVPPTGGYGRLFESMYRGSMMGTGIEVFAVMPYVVATMRGHPEHGALVELNPKLLAFTFGCAEEVVESGIRKLCAKDPESRTEKEGGRRLVKMGQFLYRVVNGAAYMAIRKAEANRMKNREAVARYRRKRAKGGGVTEMERQMTEAGKNGDKETMRRLQELTDKVPPGTYSEPPVEEGLLSDPPEE